jgi:prepilin-type N-terminal cleavage/methylation domain-containing protein
MSRYRKKSGFSLIELLCVVGIVGVLSSFALPLYTQMQIRAKQTEAPEMIQKIVNAELEFWMRPRTDATGNQLSPCFLFVVSSSTGYRREPFLGPPPLAQVAQNMITLGINASSDVYFTYAGSPWQGVFPNNPGVCGTPTSAVTAPAPGNVLQVIAGADLDHDGARSILGKIEKLGIESAYADCFDTNESFYVRNISVSSSGNISATPLQILTQPGTVCL